MNFKDYTILYAEDETIIRLNLKRFFQKYFKKVYLASNGKEALKIIVEKKPEILILDIAMPYYSGLEIAKQVREENSKIPIVIITAHNETSTLLDAIELNLTTYLIKPINNEKLATLLEKLKDALNKLTNQRIYLSTTIYWDREKGQLNCEDKEINLSIKEYKLLKLFIANINQNIYFEDIMASVWEEKFDEEISIASVKNLVSSLRKKLPKDNLKNIYGKGYILTIQ